LCKSKFSVCFVVLALMALAISACSSTPTKVYRTLLNGKSVVPDTLKATVLEGQPRIEFDLTDEGGKILGDYSETHKGQYTAITLNGQVLSCAKIASSFRGGGLAITGSFTSEAAKDMVATINKYPELLEIVDAEDSALELNEIIKTTGMH
jgi:preprotein translocase subunit SecD